MKQSIEEIHGLLSLGLDYRSFRWPLVAGIEEKIFERALRRVHFNQVSDARAFACVLVLSRPPVLIGTTITRHCVLYANSKD
jgi:hypothetical protein